MSDEPNKPAIAVALEYDRETHDAPKVVASGRGVIAEKILEVARENGIVIEANPMLAEALSGVPVAQRPNPNPTRERGMARRMTNGLRRLSYCSARTTKTRKTASSTTIVSCRLFSRIASSSPPMMMP